MWGPSLVRDILWLILNHSLSLIISQHLLLLVVLFLIIKFLPDHIWGIYVSIYSSIRILFIFRYNSVSFMLSEKESRICLLQKLLILNLPIFIWSILFFVLSKDSECVFVYQISSCFWIGLEFLNNSQNFLIFFF